MGVPPDALHDALALSFPVQVLVASLHTIECGEMGPDEEIVNRLGKEHRRAAFHWYAFSFERLPDLYQAIPRHLRFILPGIGPGRAQLARIFAGTAARANGLAGTRLEHLLLDRRQRFRRAPSARPGSYDLLGISLARS